MFIVSEIVMEENGQFFHVNLLHLTCFKYECFSIQSDPGLFFCGKVII